MDEKTKIKLALKNGCKDRMRKQKTAAAIADVYSPSREIGILGDAVEYLFELVSNLHEGVAIDPAFIEWRSKVAEIKEAIGKDISDKEGEA